MFVERVDVIAPIELKCEDFSEDKQQSLLDGIMPHVLYDYSICNESVAAFRHFWSCIQPLHARIRTGEDKNNKALSQC